MLGDLVLTDGQIAKVRGLGVYGDIEVRRENTNIYGGEKDIEPIPLTEEILLKNGFKATGAFIELEEYSLQAIDSVMCVFYNRECKNPYFYVEIANIDMEIEYVHELQQLMRRCRFDWSADNLKI